MVVLATAAPFYYSKSAILRILRHIERLEGVSLRDVTRISDGRPKKWYSLERSLNAAERQYMTRTAKEMRLLALCRDLAMPFLSARRRKTLDNSLRHVSVLLSGREQRREQASRLCQPASLGMIVYTPLQGMLDTLLTKYLLPFHSNIFAASVSKTETIAVYFSRMFKKNLREENNARPQ